MKILKSLIIICFLVPLSSCLLSGPLKVVDINSAHVKDSGYLLISLPIPPRKLGSMHILYSPDNSSVLKYETIRAHYTGLNLVRIKPGRYYFYQIYRENHAALYRTHIQPAYFDIKENTVTSVGVLNVHNLVQEDASTEKMTQWLSLYYPEILKSTEINTQKIDLKLPLNK